MVCTCVCVHLHVSGAVCNALLGKLLLWDKTDSQSLILLHAAARQARILRRHRRLIQIKRQQNKYLPTCVCMRPQNQLMSRLSGGSMETHGQSVVEWCLNKAMVEWCLNKAMWAVRPAGACVIRDWQHHLLDHPEQDKLNTDCQAQVHVQSVTGSITSLIILSRPKSAHTHLLDHSDYGTLSTHSPP